MSNRAQHYRGRFAPSPTGPLHLGSLIAALASYLDARANGGAWLVRMEDIDPPREEVGAAQRILDSLEAHGLITDEPVLFQSTRTDAYAAALAQLQEGGHLFDCDCTRAQTGPNGSCCGDCRRRQSEPGSETARRVNVPADCVVSFEDLLQGAQTEALGATLRDFVLQRKDRLIAYQLAVTVDDAEQGITHVVRGSDLMESSHRQIFLQGLLEYSTPAYCHLPVITTAKGQKLSKQNQAPALDDADAARNLRLALSFLGQTPPPEDLGAVQQLLSFAIANWSLPRVPARLSLPAQTVGLAL